MNGQTTYNLAIETSGRLGSVAVGRGAHLLQVTDFSTSLRHAVELLPSIERLCRGLGITPADIGELYVSGGPGSFTGLRISITVARTLAWAASVRVVRVPTLDVVAQNALDVDDPPPHLGVILDAKRQKVYAAAFTLRGSLYGRTTPPAECDPDTFFASLPRPAALMGEGIPYTNEAVARSGLRVLPEGTFRARAEVVHRMGFALASAGHYDDPGQLTPLYVRRPEAEEVWERRHQQNPQCLGNQHQ